MEHENKEKWGNITIRKPRKRQLSNSKTDEDLEVIEVSLQKKQPLDDNGDIVQVVGSAEKDKPLDILPTRKHIGNQLVSAIKNRALVFLHQDARGFLTVFGRFSPDSKIRCLERGSNSGRSLHTPACKPVRYSIDKNIFCF
ncbi:unnamed protein product [Caenorhabditis nigoni]